MSVKIYWEFSLFESWARWSWETSNCGGHEETSRAFLVAKGLIYLVGLEQRAARMEALVISDKPLLQEEKEKKGRKTRPPLIRSGQRCGFLEVSAHGRSPGSRRLIWFSSAWCCRLQRLEGMASCASTASISLQKPRSCSGSQAPPHVS